MKVTIQCRMIKNSSKIVKKYISVQVSFLKQFTDTKDWLLFKTPTNTSLFLAFQTTVRGDIEKLCRKPKNL